MGRPAVSRGAARRRTASALLLLALGPLAALPGACSQATPAWGPGTPRNGADQPVDSRFGTPLPGYPAINDD